MFKDLCTYPRHRRKVLAALHVMLMAVMIFLANPVSGRQATGEVSGKVNDEKGEPIAGVTIREKNGTAAAQTDGNGNFRIKVSGAESVLVFSFLGFNTQEIPVGGRSSVTVVMSENKVSLNDVVVVGYGTQRRKDVTGSISSINEKTLREVPVTNPQQLLQGRVAGVYVSQGSNRPGAEPTVRLRGNRSIRAGNNPLYVIDGIPTNDGFNDINPNDIVSMEVLKSASATAIYGSRGANGVIVITTARGKQRPNGQPEERYDTYFGKTEINRYINVLSGEQFAEYRRESYRSLPTGGYDDNDPAGSDARIFNADELAVIKSGQYTDWQRAVTQSGFQQNHQLSVLGASATTKYNLSAGFFQDEGYVKGQDLNRYSLRVNLDQDIGSRVKAGVSMLGSFSTRNGTGMNPIPNAVVLTPLANPYDAAGNVKPTPSSVAVLYNPLMDYLPGNVLREEKRSRLLASVYGEAEILEGLKLRVNFGPDLTNARLGSFDGMNSSAQQGKLAKASNTTDYIFSYTLENQLNYDKQLGKHRFGVTGLYSIQQRIRETNSANAEALPVESVTYNNLGSGTATTMTSDFSRFNILSYMGRVNYSFDDRFLLTLVARADGSSVFSEGNKWGFFPSVAAGYNIINEKFLQDVSFLSNLKLRAEYGRVGNTGINPYQTLSLLSRTTYEFNDAPAFGWRPSSIPNPNLKWETTEAYNAGIDFGFLNDRISGTVEAYRSRTFDLLLPYAIPQTTGFREVTTNIGSTRNTGFELTLSTQNITGKKFQWSSDLTGAFNKEEILELSAGKADDIGNGWFIGRPINSYYDYQKIGIWQTGETEAAQYGSATGQIKVADLNGDKKINALDRTIIGTPTPKLTYGFNNRFTYGDFDLGVFIVGVSGSTITSAFHTTPNNSIAFGGSYNVVSADYWTPKNPTNAYPRPISGTSGNPGVLFGSTLRYFDGDFVRIRNINFGYNIPKTLVNKIRAQSIRAYFNVTNPYVFSSYVHKNFGTDPEVTDSPSTINYLLGLNVRF
jgi:TonB-linked SusC/RagA family outer membrane protein